MQHGILLKLRKNTYYYSLHLSHSQPFSELMQMFSTTEFPKLITVAFGEAHSHQAP